MVARFGRPDHSTGTRAVRPRIGRAILDAGFEAVDAEVEAALTAVGEHARDRGVDPERVGVAAFSAAASAGRHGAWRSMTTRPGPPAGGASG
jgi:hypothetical protein